MKVAVAFSGLLLLLVLDYCTANCVAPWEDRDGQCMICSDTGLNVLAMTYLEAQAACEAEDGDLATISTVNHQQFAEDCGGTPWFGFMSRPNPHFQSGENGDASPPTNVVVDGGDNLELDCWSIATNEWVEEDTNCATAKEFVCSKPYSTCPNLDDDGFIQISYQPPVTPPAFPTPPGTQCALTTATYTCPAGFTVSGGTNPRTCLEGGTCGTWTGTRPTCVHVGICAALPEPANAGITYSDVPHTNGLRIIGTCAVQMCDDDYEMTSGTATRTCLAGGTWSGTAIVCQHVGTCAGLPQPENAGLTYSAGPLTNGMYLVGTSAGQTCDQDYQMTSGTGTTLRTCMAVGGWSGTPIVCEEDNNSNTLAIGLGAGLGGVAAIATIAAVLSFLRPTPGGFGPGRPPFPQSGVPRRPGIAGRRF